MASGAKRTRVGVFKGAGAQQDVKDVGFRPTKVVLRNRTQNMMLEWVESMADAAGFKTIADGTRSFITANGITPISSGFRLGTDAFNGSADEIHYECED